MRLLYFYILLLFALPMSIVAMGQDLADSGVSIHADPRLSLLFKKKASAKAGVSTAVVAKSKVDATLPKPSVIPVAKANGTTTKPAAIPAAKQAIDHVPTPLATPLTSRKSSGAIYSGKGYRVQIYNGNDRAKAINIKATFMRQFPGVRTYLTYISPCFRVKVGDYRNRSDAEGMLKEANAMYSPSMIVPDIITVNTF
jgi:hypothetical protein